MDASRTHPIPLILSLLLLTCPAIAAAETVFLCRSGEGPPLFSDLPCTRAHPADASRLGIELHNLARGMALGDADRRHLAEIDGRAPLRPGFAGLPDPERVARCEALKQEMASLRRAARQGHDGSLRSERRRLRRAIREACH
ncbi:MAG: hypothetical protein V2J24_23185 [Pseudomonadales bacterium]|jgi:hypothetical protein|nr:hypothetical protein [Pseudomonadales bacterium]